MKKLSKRKKLTRWVVKAGSNMVCSGGPLLLRAWMQQVANLRADHDIEVIWVTSGAIASASIRTGIARGKKNLPEKQALSAIGQPLVMDLYNLSLQAVGLLGAQILLTSDDISNATRRKNLQNTLETLLQWGVTPVLNENDTVATEEIKFGDNDTLSAKVACALGADRLVILTDVDGLYDSDPKKNKAAKLIRHLPGISPDLIAKTDRNAGSDRGTGGMHSKLVAASLAQKNGIDTWLVKGDIASVLERVAKNQPVGTQIARKAGLPR